MVQALVDEADEEVVGPDDARRPHGAEARARWEHGRVAVDVHRLELLPKRGRVGRVAIRERRTGLAQIRSWRLQTSKPTIAAVVAASLSLVAAATSAPATAVVVAATTTSTTALVAATTSATAVPFIVAAATSSPTTSFLVTAAAASAPAAPFLVSAAAASAPATRFLVPAAAAVEATTTAPAAATTSAATASAVVAVVLAATPAVAPASLALRDVGVRLTPAATAANPTSSALMTRHGSCSRLTALGKIKRP